MALIDCKECKAKISTDAKTCPQCGAANQAAYKGIRFGAFIYLGLVGMAFYWIWGLMTPEPRSQTDIAYTITQDEHRDGRPRKVEAVLPRRLSETELAEVAAAVRDDTNVSAERTFIGFRVVGQTESTYWASASFEPDYKSNVIGLSADEYQGLKNIDLSGYPELLGQWLRDGTLGHLMVLYKLNGKYFIDSYFTDNSKSTETYTAKTLPNGELRLEQSNDFGEYYVLKEDGALQAWSENGMYLILPKML